MTKTPVDAPSLPDGFLARLQADHPGLLLTDPSETAAYLAEERGIYQGRAAAVALPRDSAELAALVRACAAAGVPVVPQGGNTGLVGGAVSGADEIVVSLRRMAAIRAVDPVNYTVTVEAGCILGEVQRAAEAAGCLFPLSLGAEGSCTIGGNIASNAGGVGVLRYGNTRDLVLGLEVVLPDGRIWNGMRPLVKDNTGYSLKNLFIGGEGTLGIVTAAVLRLFPGIAARETAFCALPSVEAALDLLSLARRRSGDQVIAFELLSDFALEIVCRHCDGRRPLADTAPWYALIELGSSRQDGDLRAVFEGVLETAFESDLVTDAVVAESGDQAARLWQLRETIPEAQKRAGGSIKHDVSVPVSCIPAFIAEAGAAVADLIPEAHVCAFGHVGDGNVHYNVTQPDGWDKQAFLERWEEVNDRIHPIAARMQGSISAEHGIGLLKADEITRYRSAVEEDLNRAIKLALDPGNLFNPGKLVQLG